MTVQNNPVTSRPAAVHYYVTNSQGKVEAVFYGGGRQVVPTSQTAQQLNNQLRG